jgi:hypothetical protein
MAFFLPLTEFCSTSGFPMADSTSASEIFRHFICLWACLLISSIAFYHRESQSEPEIGIPISRYHIPASATFTCVREATESFAFSGASSEKARIWSILLILSNRLLFHQGESHRGHRRSRIQEGGKAGRYRLAGREEVYRHSCRKTEIRPLVSIVKTWHYLHRPQLFVDMENIIPYTFSI